LYKWGKTFYDLNKHLLDIYSKKSKSEIIEIEKIVIDNIMRGP
ncbi:ribosome biogenesis protein, partial [Sulfolobus sp. B5]